MLIQTWSHGSYNDLKRWWVYSTKMHVVILKDHKTEIYFKAAVRYVTPTCAIMIHFANTHTHIMFMSLCWKIKFVYLFTLVDSEHRKIQTPCRNESSCLKKAGYRPSVSSVFLTPSFDFIILAEFLIRIVLFFNFFLCCELVKFILLQNFL